jgi:hypothetical protein
LAESVLIEDLNVEVSLATDYIDGITLYFYIRPEAMTPCSPKRARGSQ